MNKPITNAKGNFSTVMTMILIFVSGIIIILALTSFNIANTMEQAVGVCRLSVITQSATSIGIVDQDSIFNINCDKRYVDFYNTRVELGLSPQNMHTIKVDYGRKTTKKFLELNEFVVNQVLAEELRVCKLEFGDGRTDIFPNEDNFLSDKKVCFICSEINFKPGVKKQNFTNLKDYTQNTMIQQKGITYYDYLTEETRYNNSMWFQATLSEEQYNITIDTSKQYVVYVQKYSYGVAQAALKLALIGNPATMPYAFLLRSQDAISVGIIPAKNINNVCDVQAN